VPSSRNDYARNGKQDERTEKTPDGGPEESLLAEPIDLLFAHTRECVVCQVALLRDILGACIASLLIRVGRCGGVATVDIRGRKKRLVLRVTISQPNPPLGLAYGSGPGRLDIAEARERRFVAGVDIDSVVVVATGLAAIVVLVPILPFRGFLGDLLGSRPPLWALSSLLWWRNSILYLRRR
jgi:hypothetical protein